MKKSRILVVDDEPSIRKFIQVNLAARGYDTSVAENGIEALNTFKKESIDLVLLDIMMPYLDGYEVCHRIREWSRVPIIMLSARDEENDKLRCLELGADDYITKPFSLNELLCRIKVIFRRSQNSEYSKIQSILRCGDLEIDHDHHKVYIKAQEVKLTGTEYKMLDYLAMNAGRVMSHEDILESIWGRGYLNKPELISGIVSRLRRKFDRVSPVNTYIQTITGVGYLVGDKNTILNPTGKMNNKLATRKYQQQLESKIAVQTAEIQRLSLSGIEALIYALEAKDRYTAGHSRRVSDISVAIGEALGLDRKEMDDLRWGSLLHDVGKIAVNPMIQNKEGRLTKEEYEHVMIHPRVGAQIVKPVVNQKVIDIIEHHHDHFNGGGLYQNGKGEDIPQGARVIAVADAFDAMTSDRPYRAKMTDDEAMKEVLRCTLTQFDPAIVTAFLKSGLNPGSSTKPENN
jgi:putative nucleotidyltransferase with HDIG domain